MTANDVCNVNASPETQIAHGSCLCGGIKYSITGNPSMTVLCHCINCKKSSGSAFMANGSFEKAQLNITHGAESLKTYIDTSPDAGGSLERSFCSNCGSPLFITHPKHASIVAVTGGTLDDVPTGLWKPQMEYYCKRKVDWLEGISVEKNRFMGME